MEFKEVKAWIEKNMNENEELKSYLAELGKVTQEKVEKWIEEEEGKKFISRINDKFFSKALETWKQNNLEKEIEKEIKKRFPEKSEKDIELEKVKTELEKLKAEAIRKELTNKALKIATEKKLPTDLIEYFIADDEENTIKNLEKFEKIYNKHLQEAIQEKIKDNSYIPPKGTNNDAKSIQEIFRKALNNY